MRTQCCRVNPMCADTGFVFENTSLLCAAVCMCAGDRWVGPGWAEALDRQRHLGRCGHCVGPQQRGRTGVLLHYVQLPCVEFRRMRARAGRSCDLMGVKDIRGVATATAPPSSSGDYTCKYVCACPCSGSTGV
jgi:hypothetical protein